MRKLHKSKLLFLLPLLWYSCDNPKNTVLESETPTTNSKIISEEVKNVTTNNDLSGPSKVIDAPIPEQIDFAGEFAPIADIDIRERLDYELTVNMYYHSKMQFYLKRANRWFPVIEPILKEEGMPEDFKYLAVIESALSQATSPSGAKGFWQFMNGTGKEYGLRINKEIDERYHVEKSTRAACEYLRKAKKKFGNWTAAAASYNMGKAGLSNRMESQYSENYYDLRLNNETSRYIFRLLAIKEIMENPKKYGFNLEQRSLYQPYETEVIVVDSAINDVAAWAVEKGTNYKVLKKLNPWILGNSLPSYAGSKFEVLLPNKGFPLKPMKSYE